jgi:cell fate regulator YaaT (PSP1 superfamily)
MGCAGCSVATENGTPSGCGSKGNCATGGCNRLNTFDWLSQMEISDVDGFAIVEVSFKNGARKAFFHTDPYVHITTGDMVVVEAQTGYDIGRVTLSGELVRLQMKKRKVREDQVLHGVIRRANQRDLERLQEAREQEHPTLVRSRAIARSLKLDMKMGDVEFQGDKRKATFYYTANGRVDFRELIRHYAREFRVKIEMRQIGARQESARIGGLGSCGRELCCSTWLTDFKSVSTAAARYQNLAINQSKLSGQCGRLKCCLNYELDTYMEAIKAFPERADKLQTEAGTAVLVKTDIFKQIMYYAYQDSKNRGGKLYALQIEQVKEVQKMNKKGEKPVDLGTLVVIEEPVEQEPDFEDINNILELPPEERRKKKRRKKKNKPGQQGGQDDRSAEKTDKPDREDGGDGRNKNRRRNNRRSNRNRGKDGGGGNQGEGGSAKASGDQRKNPGDDSGNKSRRSSGRRNRGRGRRNNNKDGGGPKKDSDG